MKRIYLFFILLLSVTNVFGQIDTEFWFAVPKLSQHTQEAEYHIMITTFADDADVVISMPANNSFVPRTAHIAKHSFHDIIIAATYSEAQTTLETPYNVVSQKGLFVQSDAPITCYFQITDRNGEVYSFKGKNALGTEFIVLMQKKFANASASTSPLYKEAYNSVEIVATEDNTVVTIVPSQQTGVSCTTSTVSVTLNKGETYAIKACSKDAVKHLAGTRITSSKPIAVNSTDDTMHVKATDGNGCDLVGDQILPVTNWGDRYIAISQRRSWEGVIIFSKEDNTQVSSSTLGTITLNNGESRFLSLADLDAEYISSTKPVGVWQITGLSGEGGGTMLPCLTCTGSNSVSYKRIVNSVTTYYNIVTESKNIDNFSLNGNHIHSSIFSVVPNTGGKYSYAKYDVSNLVGISEVSDIVCSSGLFHLSVLDFLHREISDKGELLSLESSNYGYFSNYGTTHEYDEYATISQGQTYTWKGHKTEGGQDMTFTKEGMYKDPLTDIHGCDSTCVLHLKVIPYHHILDTISGCYVPINVCDSGIFQLKNEWSSSPIVSNLNIPLVGDLDDDGIPEIICWALDGETPDDPLLVNKILVFDGKTKLLKTTIPVVKYVSAFNAACYGLVKLPSRKGLIVTLEQDGYLRAYDIQSINPSIPYWVSDQPCGDYMSIVSFADFNNDGHPEIYCHNRIFNAETGVLLAKAKGINEGASFTHYSHVTNTKVAAPFAANILGDSHLELICGNVIYSVSISNLAGEEGNKIEELERITPPDGVVNDGHTQVADFNGDGHLDVFITNRDNASSYGGIVSFYIWDVFNNQCSNVIKINTTFSGKSIPLIADLNSDGVPEIVIQCDVLGQVYMRKGALWCYQYDPMSQNFTRIWTLNLVEDSYSNTMTAFDFDMDGSLELLVCDEQQVRVVKGSSGTVLSSMNYAEVTIMQYPVIADIDGDQISEFVSVGSHMLNVFESASGTWAMSRPVWNQYMYNMTNVNSDLTIPSSMVNNAEIFYDKNDPTIHKQPYNGFLQQTTFIDDNGSPINPAADAAVTNISRKKLESDSVEIMLSYCNNGDADLIAPYEITTYVNAYQGRVAQVDTIKESLDKGQCTTLRIAIPATALSQTGDSYLVVAINDDGHGIAQNGNQQAECDTTNNRIQTRIPKCLLADTTIESLTICETDLPYTHPTTGIVFDKSCKGVVDTTVFLVSAAGCDSVVQIKLAIYPIAKMTIRKDTTCTVGDSVLLWSKGADFVRWESKERISQSFEREYFAHPTKSAMYYAYGYSKVGTEGNNLTINGDFEQGNTGFETQLAYYPPAKGYGRYTIGEKTSDLWGSIAPDSAKAFGGKGMMIIDGTEKANTKIWVQTVFVLPNTYYAFSGQVMSCLFPKNPSEYAQLQFSVNGEQIGDIFHSPYTVYRWQLFYNIWYSGNNTTATLCILNQNSGGEGNDFTLDDIRFEPLNTNCAAVDSVLIMVMQHGSESQTICEEKLPYRWHNRNINVAGTYVDTIVSSTGYRDSVVTLYLSTKHCCDPLKAKMSVPDICADAKTMDIQIDLASGEIEQYEIHFTNAAKNKMPFRDTVIQAQPKSPSYVSVTVPHDDQDMTKYPRPDDTYSLNMTIRDQCGNTQSLGTQSFTVLYPSWIIEQNWDDVIAVVNDQNNGGYMFSKFEWLQGDEIMAGEDSYYIYLPHQLWTNVNHAYQSYEYRARLTRTDDGKAMLTCPITPRNINSTNLLTKDYIDIVPTIVPIENPVVHVMTNTTGTYYVYSATGVLLQTADYEPCEHDAFDIRLWNTQTMYVLVFVPRGSSKPLKDKYGVFKVMVE